MRIIICFFIVLACFLTSCNKDVTDDLEINEQFSKEHLTDYQTDQEHFFTCLNKNLPQLETATERATGQKGKFWRPGQNITIRFLGGTRFQHDMVRQFASEWESFANINLNFDGRGDTNIRISFDGNGGNWSYVGTDALKIKQKNATMNYDFNDRTSIQRIRRVVLHEFGHALGLLHEHQHPQNGIQWDKDALYEHYEAFGWSKEKVDKQIINNKKRSETNYTNYDSESIMHYPISSNHTLNGYSVESRSRLSYQDIRFISLKYPFAADWSDGWTTARFYTIKGQTYVLLLKKNQGKVHIRKVNSNGRLGTKIYDKKWSSGWSNVEFFEAGGQTYMFLLKEKNGSVKIYKMQSNGKIGKIVKDYNWTGGWSNTEFYTINGNTYLFLMKKKGVSNSGKNVHIHKMNSNGTIGKTIVKYKWKEGWKAAKFYEVGGKPHVFLYKGNTGRIHIRQLKSNGTLGTKTFDDQAKGWTTTEFYKSNSVNYAFFLKEKGGTVHIHDIH